MYCNTEMRNKMPEYSSRKDQLWYVARQLVEEEAKLIQIAQLEGNFMLLFI